MKEIQPHAWMVIRSGNDQYPGRYYLRLHCARSCEVPLSTSGPREANGTKQWGWDGDCEAPTVTPSINCQQCGWHKVITKGSAT